MRWGVKLRVEMRVMPVEVTDWILLELHLDFKLRIVHWMALTLSRNSGCLCFCCPE